MTGLSDALRQTRFDRLRFIAPTIAGILFGSFQLFQLAGLRLNFSPSLPAGLYVKSSTGPLAEFCPAEPFGSLAIERAYRDPGTCPDHAAPLLKPIVATPGNVVELSQAGIAVNGHLLLNTAPLPHDTKGRPLWSFAPGRYLVAPGTVWVASTYNPRSFDSRYFGAISDRDIRARLRPLLTWR